jgi:nitroreductase
MVVTEERLRGAIAAVAGEEDYVAKGFEPWLSSAPVHVVVCVDEGAYRHRYASADKVASDPEEWPVPYPYIDAGASVMLLLLAAVDEGLAAGFLGAHRLSGIGSLLGIPQEITIIGLVTLGHAAPDRRSGSLAAGWKPLEDVVHWEGWTRA